MTKILLLLIVLYADDVKVTKKYYVDSDACRNAGAALMAELDKDPKVEDVLFGACIKMPVVEAKK